MQKETIAKLLGEQEVDDAGYESNADTSDELPKWDDVGVLGRPDVRRMLEIRSMLGSSSITKLDTMLACVGYDGRARGLLQYHAAGPGRWGGRIIQPQNFPRGDWKRKGITVEQTVAAIMSGDPAVVERSVGTYVDSETGEVVHANAIQCVADSLRHALIPDPDKVFLVGDYAGIEARVVLALAGQHDKTALMASGQDVYLDVAHRIYNRPPGSLTKANVVERTIGKNTVLGCGFQMGTDRFHERYCPKQPLSFAAEVIETYRHDWAPKVPELWYGLQDAALKAVKTGRAHEAYGVVYRREGDFITASLPSGWQKLWYYRPELGISPVTDRECWFSWTSKNGKWVRRSMYGGLLTENVVQGLARGLLCAAIDRLEQAGMPVVLTVHDEIVVELDKAKADVLRFKQLMAQPTEWSDRIGIPIEVEEWVGDRYRK
jgi:DNA polymerase